MVVNAPKKNSGRNIVQHNSEKIVRRKNGVNALTNSAAKNHSAKKV